VRHPAAIAPASKPPAVPSLQVAESRPAATPAALRREETRQPVATTVSVSPTLGAVDTCKDKFFLAKEFCLAEACDRPGARSHPLCVKHREDARMREESRIRN
jgi:serine/threonine-protein kinase